ncbi:uncharacterized protein BDR25DRAFT_380309 [Lindgomyces ingoldianus]|uniref:Uncharacterized protein n=1 Tax=Lindgomyces ingoldianus TaxID=673940 RepID=A0ACB6QFG0_9PLEO|nr:uncharacterized protein BDR25DRAFT_380309 [Lindgomyces ingoldianus]KAF2464871.1 hypothetical protein BDR25DRAFT_380309 [Lindgomyces ingoldianus]
MLNPCHQFTSRIAHGAVQEYEHFAWIMAKVQVVQPVQALAKDKSKFSIAVSPPLPTLRPNHEANRVTLSEITSLRMALQGFHLGGHPNFLLDHLHATPWLGSRWSKSDIVFRGHSADQGASVHILAEIRHPHIVHVCDSGTCEYQACNCSHTAFGDDSAKIIDLGILLFEIYFNQPMENFYTNEEFADSRNKLNDSCVVRRWMNREREKLSGTFQNAIAHCLRCFANPDANLQDTDFRQGVVDHMLFQLQDELSIWIDDPPKAKQKVLGRVLLDYSLCRALQYLRPNLVCVDLQDCKRLRLKN